MDKLTPKQKRFVLNILKGMSQREAYIKAGYSNRSKPATIDSHACRLVQSAKIMTRLAELQQAAEDVAVMNVRERKKRLSEIGRARLNEFIDSEGQVTLHGENNGALQEVVIEDWRGAGEIQTRNKKIKLHNPIEAIKELNKMGGDYPLEKKATDALADICFVIGKGYTNGKDEN